MVETGVRQLVLGSTDHDHAGIRRTVWSDDRNSAA